MSDEDKLSYEEVEAVADSLTAEGRRVTLEYLRRALGKGTHAEIAVHMGRWQRSKNERPQALARHASSENAVHKKNHADNGSNSSLRRPRPIVKEERSQTRQSADIPVVDTRKSRQSAAPDFKRLEQEAVCVKKLFEAIAFVKQSRAKAVERQHKIQSELLALRVEHDRVVRELKKNANEDLFKLQAEYTRLKSATKREIFALRDQTGL
ncbi:MAG: DNA-binding protein [Francisellaceae bacterium]